MGARSPQRFSGRAGSQSTGRLRRALDGAIDTDRRYGNTLEIKDKRLEAKVTPGGGLLQTKRGLEIDQLVVGDKNRPQLNFIRDIDAAATNQTINTKLNEILSELRRTGRMRGA